MQRSGIEAFVHRATVALDSTLLHRDYETAAPDNPQTERHTRGLTGGPAAGRTGH
jgi:hypothetical protein